MSRASRIKLSVCLLVFIIATATCTASLLNRDPASGMGLAAGTVLVVFSAMLVGVVFLVPSRD